jgi:hypothetical protein
MEKTAAVCLSILSFGGEYCIYYQEISNSVGRFPNWKLLECKIKIQHWLQNQTFANKKQYNFLVIFTSFPNLKIYMFVHSDLKPALRVWLSGRALGPGIDPKKTEQKKSGWH